MKTMLTYLIPILAAMAVFAFTNKTTNHLCKHPFALCTSARCIPDPSDATKAICKCVVQEGPSLATVPCNTLAPSTDKNGIRTVYSTFSLDQFNAGKQGMKCPSDTPWTWCLNKRCTVDPSDPQQAICTCDVKRDVGEWMTLGGNCDTSTCQTGYWSGALLSDFDDGIVFLQKALKIKTSPVKWCPAS